jgi:DNA-binding transcriptional regulator YiaG
VAPLKSLDLTLEIVIYVDHVCKAEAVFFETITSVVAMSCRPRPQIARSRSRAAQPKRLGKRLYEWRKRNDFSQSEAALKLQVSKRTLQEWEQGRAQPRHLALASINGLIKS